MVCNGILMEIMGISVMVSIGLLLLFLAGDLITDLYRTSTRIKILFTAVLYTYKWKEIFKKVFVYIFLYI